MAHGRLQAWQHVHGPWPPWPMSACSLGMMLADDDARVMEHLSTLEKRRWLSDDEVIESMRTGEVDCSCLTVSLSLTSLRFVSWVKVKQSRLGESLCTLDLFSTVVLASCPACPALQPAMANAMQLAVIEGITCPCCNLLLQQKSSWEPLQWQMQDANAGDWSISCRACFRFIHSSFILILLFCHFPSLDF